MQRGGQPSQAIERQPMSLTPIAAFNDDSEQYAPSNSYKQVREAKAAIYAARRRATIRRHYHRLTDREKIAQARNLEEWNR
jgi:hypothetical protein